MSKVLRSTTRVVRSMKDYNVAASVRLKSTESNILKSKYKDIKLECKTVNDFVWQNLDRWPDKTATVR